MCDRIAVADGPEDFELDAARNRLIVASKPPMAVPLDRGSARELAIVPGSHRIHMVGISLHGDELFAINKKTKSVDVFTVGNDTLTLHRTLASPTRKLVSPNEVLAVDGGHVYVTNAQGRRGLLGAWEALTQRKWANVLRWDPFHKDWEVAARGIGFGNGMQSRRDRLYVAGFDEQVIHEYAIAANGTLSHVRTLPVGAHPDNLKWLDDHTLLIAAHPSRFRTFRHLLTRGRTNAPSEVRILDVDAENPRGEVFFYTNEIDVASTAMVHEDRLILSQIVKPFLLSCPRPQP